MVQRNQEVVAMFDNFSNDVADQTLEKVRLFFGDYGHDLAEAVEKLSGSGGESRVISCALELERATQMNGRIRSALRAIYRVLSLDAHPDGDDFEDAFFLPFEPDSPEVERICLLTDLLGDLISEVDLIRSAESIAFQRIA